MEKKAAENKPSGKHSFVVIFLIVLIVGLGYEIFALKKEQKSAPVFPVPSPETVSIDVVPLAPENVTLSKHYIGYVEPVHSVSVLPFISGFIENVHVCNGQFVRAGQLLAILEQGAYKADLQTARAAVMQANANYQNAAAYYKRIKAAGKKAIAQADRDKALADFLSAKAAFAQAQAQLSAAEVNYNYTIIRAPISGIIGTVGPTKGDYVSPAGQPLMTIMQVTPVKVVFSLTDKDYIRNVSTNGLSDLLKGNKIRLQLPDGKFYPFEGVYQYTENALNKGTNSVAVYVAFDNKNNILLPNTYVTVYLEQTYQNVVAVPQSQVTMTPAGNFITTADKNGFHKQKIDIIDTQGENYIVKNTFAPQTYLVKGRPPALKENEPFKLNILSDNAE
ncbi:MAG: efflux RND transporter periplasmic adaptor subunit [Alphaproteobacteria bacterium]|nr:efflux RND transporter periplasmic adaptor subunit [Alphaproteobacteria bacterium]